MGNRLYWQFGKPFKSDNLISKDSRVLILKYADQCQIWMYILVGQKGVVILNLFFKSRRVMVHTLFDLIKAHAPIHIS